MQIIGEQYVDSHEVSRKVGLDPKTIRRKVRERLFPAPFLWGGGWRWVESDVDKWMVRNAARLEIDPDTIPEEKKRRGVEVRGQTGTSDTETGSGAGKTKLGR